MSNHLIGFILLTVALLATCLPAAAQSPDRSYLSKLVKTGLEKKLAGTRDWQLLLHYRDDMFGGVTSEQDDAGFFLSPRGKTDPQDELKHTLAAFFSEELVGRSQQPAQCAFIARYHWLNEQLQFDDQLLPPIRCDRYDRWLTELNPQGITLIFPSAFMNNPASMFGHTFLRVDQKGQTEQTRLLAYTINYAAEVPPGEGIAYPVKGIFGNYKGNFSTPPYYLKVQEYRDIENRDIWEYRLNFTEPQLLRLLMHAWEMGNASFDYFFFKENCSYHILSLLEYANPALHLRDRFFVWTVPADTVRLIVAEPGLVGDIAFRPSRHTLIRRKRELLSDAERTLVPRLARDTTLVQASELARLPIARQAFVLDVTSDYLRYQSEDDSEESASYKERNRTILTARSNVKIPSEALSIAPFAKQPELGHNTSRASVGAGWRNNDTFEEFTARAGYHDLLDPEIGYTPDAQIELASLSVRHYNRADHTRIERATLANVLSLSPIDALFQAPSWKVNIGMQTLKHRGCQLCSNGVANGGIGAAVESHWLKREVFFAFAEAEGNYSKAYEERHRIGGGGTVGMYGDLTDRWRLMLTGSYLRFALGDKSEDFRWFVGSRYTLSQNWALRLEYNHRSHDNDVLFSVQAFF